MSAELARDLEFVTYEVVDDKVRVPDGAEIVCVVTADEGGLGHRRRIVAVTVAVSRGLSSDGHSLHRDELPPPSRTDGP
jgi:hypothetical protein